MGVVLVFQYVGRNTRFQRKLVDSGLWQSLGVNYYTLNQVGPITISGEVAPGKLREAVAALDKELLEVVKPGYITAETVDGVKRTRIVGTMESLEKTSGFTHQLGFWWAVTGLDYFFGYVDTMARLELPPGVAALNGLVSAWWRGVRVFL